MTHLDELRKHMSLVFGWDELAQISLPVIYDTDDDPPVLLKLRAEHPEANLDDPEQLGKRVWDVDLWLGCYSAKEMKVTLYKRSIEQCAMSLSIDPSTLWDIVRFHELAHWATHLGPFPGMPPKWEVESFNSHGEGIHEFLAQLFTSAHCRAKGDEFTKAMETLTNSQSDAYKSYKEAERSLGAETAVAKAKLYIGYLRKRNQCGEAGSLLKHHHTPLVFHGIENWSVADMFSDLIDNLQ